MSRTSSPIAIARAGSTRARRMTLLNFAALPNSDAPQAKWEKCAALAPIWPRNQGKLSASVPSRSKMTSEYRMAAT
jgi:hypothetical protein